MGFDIRKLMEEATPGPWFPTCIGAGKYSTIRSTVTASDSELRFIANCRDTNCIEQTPNAINAELICRAVNALPAVLELLAAESEYRRLHDFAGDGALTTGRAWDRMRKASEELVKALGAA